MADNNTPNANASVSPVAQDTATSPATYTNTMSGAEAQAKEIVDANRETDTQTTQQVAGKGGDFDGMDILDASGTESAAALNEVSASAGMPVTNANSGSTATLNSGLSIDRSVVAHTLDKPAAGQTAHVDVQAGEMLATSFDPDTANLDMQGNDLVMSFNDGSKIILNNFAADTQNMPSIALPNGALVAGGVIVAQLQGTNDDLFNLETAAGATLTSGRFAYSDDFGNVIGLLDKLPPIGFTALEFPQPEPRVTIDDDLVNDPAGGDFTTTVTSIDAIFGTVSGGFEDWQPHKNTGDTTLAPAAFTVNFVPQDNEIVELVTISNIPAGIQFFYGTTGNYTAIPAVNGSITFTGDQMTAGNIFVLDSSKSDTDIPLTVSLLVSDPTTESSAVLTKNIIVITDAVADLPTLTSSVTIDTSTATSGLVQGTEDDLIKMQVKANFFDNDGSETHTIILSGVPSEWTLNSSPGLTFTTVTAANGTVTYTAVVSGNAATSLLTFDPNNWSSKLNGDASLKLVVRAEELVSDQELTLANNVAQVETDFTIRIAEDVPTIIAIAPPQQILEDVLLVPGTDVVSGNITVEFNTDNPGTLALSLEGLAALGLKSHGQTLTYSIDASGSLITARAAGGAVIFTIDVSPTTQAGTKQTFTYDFTLFKPVDHPDGTSADSKSIPVKFIAKDSDGDTVSGNFEVRIIDDLPAAQSVVINTDETNQLNVEVTGNLTVAFGADGAGVVKSNDNFAASGSLKGGALSSGGVPVTVSLVGGAYVGKAGGVTVFTLTVNSDGTYKFVQLKPLDHADGANANDVINLKFGYSVTDYDGDKVNQHITIRVADDAPKAFDDFGTIANGASTATGNVLANDTFSKDVPDLLKSVTAVGVTKSFATDAATDAGGKYVLINGAYGVLKIYQDGKYTYTYDNAKYSGNHSEQFNYVLVDSDADTSAAKLILSISDNAPGAAPNIEKTIDETTDIGKSVTGTIVVTNATTFVLGTPVGAADFTATGSVKGAILSSNGVPVTVALVNGAYVGTAGGKEVFTLTIAANGTYTFIQKAPLDHADGSNANDVINLNFNYTAKDADGDAVDGDIVIHVRDDAPLAIADIATIADGGSTATGNVITNDTLSKDVPNLLQSVSGKAFATPDGTDAGGKFVLVNGSYGVLKIYENGQYTYTYDNAKYSGSHNEQFTYTLVDRDGDVSSTTLKLSITDNGPGNAPNIEKTIDETTDIGKSVTGTLTVPDATSYTAGSNGTPTFTVGGSIKGGALASNGVPITVSLVNGNYVGVAGTKEIFTLVINSNGGYTFIQKAPIDHADGSDANDVINLNFTYTAKDADGDAVLGNIKVNIKDDAPDAIADTGTIANGSSTATGNVIPNDILSKDTPNILQSAAFGGTTKSFATPSGTDAGGKFVLIDGSYGQLKIYENGQYTYTYDNAKYSGNHTEQFTYTLVDRDGDVDSTTLTLSIIDNGPGTAPDVVKIVDETTDLGKSFSDKIIVANASSFTLGSPTGQATFNADGSVKGAALTSNGVPVTVALLNGHYVGTANGKEIFDLAIKNDGTYTFVQKAPIDHADGTNANDVINLNFTYTVRDADGDANQGDITIKVRDDAPIAKDDTGHIPDGQTIATGNVLTNDTLSQDIPNLIKEVSHGAVTKTFASDSQTDAGGKFVLIDGEYGQLKVYENGKYAYTYDTDEHSSRIIDQYVLPSNAIGFPMLVERENLENLSDPAKVQILIDTANALKIDFPTHVNIEMQKSSGKVAGSTNALGAFTLNDNGTISNVKMLIGEATANASNPISAADMKATYDMNDANGRVVFFVMRNSFSDLLQAGLATQGGGALNPSGTTLSIEKVGDHSYRLAYTGADGVKHLVAGDPLVTSEQSFNYDSKDHAIAGTTSSTDAHSIQFGFENNGTNGSDFDFNDVMIKVSVDPYAVNGPDLEDKFTYTVIDKDGDTDKANIDFTITDNGPGDAPTVIRSLDETTDINVAISDKISVQGANNYALGAVTGAADFVAGGSIKDGKLTSNGVNIIVKLVNGHYVGTAGNKEVFDLSIANDGTYKFILKAPIDHADGNNANDVIRLNFSYTARDADGDASEGNIEINVKDDAPLAVADVSHLADGAASAGGNVITNDTLSKDVPNLLKDVGFGASSKSFTTPDGTDAGGKYVFINGAQGQLKIYETGQYTYSLNGGAPLPGSGGTKSDVFNYTLKDQDGDISKTTLSFDVSLPKLVVGKNVDDKDGSTTPYQVGPGSGKITGDTASDLLAGDSGGSKLQPQEKDYNIVLVLDVSGSMNDNNKIALLKNAVNSLLGDFHDYKGGDVKVHIVPFSTASLTTATFTVTADGGFNSAVSFINGLKADGYTNFEAPLKSAIDWLQGATSNDPIPGAETFTYFVSDGEPNRYLNGSTVATGSADVVMSQITGSDGSNEVAILQGYGEVVGVGIGVNSTTIGRLSIIDSGNDSALDVRDPNDLSKALQGASPLNTVSDVGSDVLNGGDGNDLIFGDAFNTDKLADAKGLSTAPGAGWSVFSQLEASQGWSRADTVNYIRTHVEEIGRETHTNSGHGRDGGHDTINGGDGNDVIFGQEGNDVINGGIGNDLIAGGSGNNSLTGGAGADTFLFLKNEAGNNLITDYSKAQNDKLDISDLLTDSGYIPGISQINDFVKIDDANGNVHVDITGKGSFNAGNHIATIENVGSLDSVNVILNDDEGSRLIHTV